MSEDTISNPQEDEYGSSAAVRLPDEVLFYIFDSLPIPLLHKVSFICRRWRRLSTDVSLWKGRFCQRWVIAEPSKWEILLMSQSWKG